MRLTTVFLGLTCVALSASSLASGCGGDAQFSSPSSSGTTGGGECPLSDPSCNVVPSDCLALTDNSSLMTFGLRMTEIYLTSPPSLAAPFVRDLVKGDSWPVQPLCGYMAGTGVFTWILQFDLAAKKLTTGGAKPLPNSAPWTDPKKAFSFVDETVNGVKVTPLVLDVTLVANSDGTISFDAMKGGDVVVPIYTDPMATASKAILLPLHAARLFGGKLSKDHDCVGALNHDLLKATQMCEFQKTDQTFEGGGKLEAYIRLDESDQIPVPTLGGASLCTLLTGTRDMSMPAKCDQTNPKYTGDWCAATDMPADAMCHDAFKLVADFGASAVKIQ